MQPDIREPEASVPVLPVEVGVLGAVATRIDGVMTPLPGNRSRALLVALGASPGRIRSAAALIDDVWPDEAPRSPKNALQTQISRLRSALAPGLLESGPAGYRLVLTVDQFDLTCAQSRASDARANVAEGRFDEALISVASARSLWRGEPAADLPASGLAEELGRRAKVVARALDEIEIGALLALGDHDRALPLIRAAVHHDPLDEQAAEHLMRCLNALGRTNDALAAFARIRGSLADALGTDPSAMLVELNAELLEAPPAKVAVAIGLRAAPNELIGREADIAALEALMARSRSTTILGPGGSGKTRIAHELGARARENTPVAVVELASLRRGQDVAAAITSTLGLSETELKIGRLGIGRVHTAQERLREALSARPSLLILDNCEHVVDDVALIVDELISASEHVTILATSRSPLAITAEVTYPLPPLYMEGPGSPAAELFVARARAVRPGVMFDPAEVDRLCRTLDGLPLAIELAAARVRTLAVADINSRLEHRFALLRSSDRTRPERHRTLHAVIDWSWNLLEQDQQLALTRLCRFPAGFTAHAAEHVAGFGGVDDVLDAIGGLVGQSLLTVVDEGDHIRYHMLETVREFGEEQLDDADDAVVTERMLQWGSSLARTVTDGYRQSRQIEVIRILEEDHDNLLDVLRHALHARRWPVAYAIFAALSYFWSMRGAHTEVLNWAPRFLRAPIEGAEAAEIIDDDVVLTNLVILAHAAHDENIREAARIRVRIRRCLSARRRIEPGLRFVAEILVGRSDGRGLARKLARGIRDREASVRNLALMFRATLHENLGCLHEGARDAEAAKCLAERRGDLWIVASSSQALGSIHGQSGRHEDAIANYTMAADLLWDLHAYDESIQMRGYASGALIAAGRIDEGRAMAETMEMSAGGQSPIPASSIPIDADTTDQRLASVTATLAEADIAEGKIKEGLAQHRRAVDIAGFAGDSRGDPSLTMLASASVSAHALHGGTGTIVDAAAVLEFVASTRMGPGGFRDLPQLGAVACAIGSFDIQSRRDPDRGIRLLAISVKAKARQDYPSMRPERHLDAARAVLGDRAVDVAIKSVAHTTRAGALAEILELLRP
ncbi:BTAD domain-containing putative transcriptional regulator [Rhodococcus sp. G-MC3]|uniref:BTAD domain-containing putative transcriptional regulator n=1 Tax=Rhodococcus sp. G-MC3 TaxID=3046209 RepID=UPI0024BB39A5|nr:BTAD domain-containing putative transcriptional regulator [Rhodococcus sp. G-MC3]MDJ0392127.1 BTAD domain-containing putative transcriptional regulator [Rhodococcus sp. G-MC3]